jgi:hypothetical protein
MKVGIIQTRGIGDIIIAAPIAKYFIDRGHEVFWPIDSDFLEPFKYALPSINFLSIDKNIVGGNTAEFFIEGPKKIINQLKCDVSHILYSHLTSYDFGQSHICDAISFDSYKYAICGVPFYEKWNLKVIRNPIREAALFTHLGLSPKDQYVVHHEQGSIYNFNFDQICNQIYGGVRVIKLTPITNNFFDWLGVIENSNGFFTVNSAYSNLVDQLGFDINKYLKCQTPAQWTPVFKNKWNYI